MHDGGGTEQDIQRQVETAPNTPKAPVAHDLIGQGKWDNEGGYKDIGCSHRHQEEILWGPKGTASVHS